MVIFHVPVWLPDGMLWLPFGDLINKQQCKNNDVRGWIHLFVVQGLFHSNPQKNRKAGKCWRPETYITYPENTVPHLTGVTIREHNYRRKPSLWNEFSHRWSLGWAWMGLVEFPCQESHFSLKFKALFGGLKNHAHFCTRRTWKWQEWSSNVGIETWKNFEATNQIVPVCPDLMVTSLPICLQIQVVQHPNVTGCLFFRAHFSQIRYIRPWKFSWHHTVSG